MRPPKEGKLLYHLTKIDNLQSIFQIGLLSRNQLLRHGIIFNNIANMDIIEKRKNTNLENYVPFHFYAKNPFDWCVCKQYGSENMALITILREYAHSVEAFIVPSHPIGSENPQFFTFTEGLDKIEWSMMDTNFTSDQHVKNVRMAEVLIPSGIPANAFFKIFVKSEWGKQRIIQETNCPPDLITVNAHMFPNY